MRGGGMLINHIIDLRNQRIDMRVTMQDGACARMLTRVLLFKHWTLENSIHGDDSKLKTACLHCHTMHVGSRRALGAIGLDESSRRIQETIAFSHLPFIMPNKT